MRECLKPTEETLYVSDLDGTLLTGEQRLTDFTLRVLNRLVRRGVKFTYATARSRNSAEVVTRGLTKSLPVIVYNGAFIRRGDTGELLGKETLLPAQVDGAREIFRRHGISPLVYTLLEGVERVRWRPGRETPGVARYLEQRRGDPRFLPAGGEDSLYEGEVFYFTGIGEREDLEPAWEELSRVEGLRALLQEEIYQPGEFWLEVMPQGATKANAARLLAKRLGCRRMVAFGDGLNDLPLFEAAQERCAVENAAPPLKEAADWVIPGSEEDGVAKWLLADTAPVLALGERAGEFRLRLYRQEDLEELVRLFYHTVRTVARKDYTREETEAWAPSPESVDRDAWGKSLSEHYTLVAEREGQLVGFGDLDSTGYLDRLYVHKDFQGRGVATALAEALEGCAWGLGAERVTVHASRTARPLFERRGYQVVTAQRVIRRGVELENFVMERRL